MSHNMHAYSRRFKSNTMKEVATGMRRFILVSLIFVTPWATNAAIRFADFESCTPAPNTCPANPKLCGAAGLIFANGFAYEHWSTADPTVVMSDTCGFGHRSCP